MDRHANIAGIRPPDRRLGEIADKVLKGARLTTEDGLHLLRTPGIAFPGLLANLMREKLHGTATTFSVNRHINFSNICRNRCSFCAFRRNEGEPGAERLSPREIVNKALEAGGTGSVEIHITGALDPFFSLRDALDMVTKLKAAMPRSTIKAFTLVEIDHFSEMSGKPPEEVMALLKEAGVSAFPGGGAELFGEEVREKLCPEKISGARWLQLAELAHESGIPTNATMLYGVGETDEDRIDHLMRLRDLQDRTGGFMAFIPLLFQKENTALSGIRALGACEQLRVYAVSRLILDNIPHIKVHWVMSGLKTAELSQWFGADDIEGTVHEERIGHEGGAETPVGLTKDDVMSLIERSGRLPRERDGLYNPVHTR